MQHTARMLHVCIAWLHSWLLNMSRPTPRQQCLLFYCKFTLLLLLVKVLPHEQAGARALLWLQLQQVTPLVRDCMQQEAHEGICAAPSGRASHTCIPHCSQGMAMETARYSMWSAGCRKVLLT